MPILRFENAVQVAHNNNKSQSGLKNFCLMEISKETQEAISKLQLMEQNIQTLLMQKQQFQAQLFEVESALKEIEKTDEHYKIIGNVMIKTDKATLKAELGQKKEILDLRLKNIDKQEKQLKEKAEHLQKDIMGKIKK